MEHTGKACSFRRVLVSRAKSAYSQIGQAKRRESGAKKPFCGHPGDQGASIITYRTGRRPTCSNGSPEGTIAMRLLAYKNRKMRARVLTRYALPLHPFCIIPLHASRSAIFDTHNTARNQDPPLLQFVCGKPDNHPQTPGGREDEHFPVGCVPQTSRSETLLYCLTDGRQ